MKIKSYKIEMNHFGLSTIAMLMVFIIQAINSIGTTSEPSLF